MKLKWYGTATILLEHAGTKLLFDPFLPLSENVFKPTIDQFSAADNILVTHGHLDHIAHIPAILRQGDGAATVFCTAKPRETLISKHVDAAQIHMIAPGDVLKFGPFEVRVLKGKHIVFDIWLIIKKLLNPRLITNRRNVRYLFEENKKCVEAGETVIFDIAVPDKRILVMGSLNLDRNTVYPKDADLLVLPLQGRSGIGKYAMRVIDRLQPKKVLLDHFDNSFPPISSPVDTGKFVALMRKKYPGVPVICPEPSDRWIAF